MLCEECKKNEATMHMVKTVNGVRTERHLCEKCAQNNQEFADLDMWNGGSFFKDFFSFGDLAGIGAGMQQLCQKCGTTLAEFESSGLLGCPDCYDSFADTVIPVIKRAHGNDTHKGSAPEKADEKLKLREKRKELQAEMKKAIKDERFEDAAKLRDEIAKLNSEDNEK